MAGKSFVKKNILLFVLILMFAVSSAFCNQNESDSGEEKFQNHADKERLRRENSFLGIHFDFHAKKEDKRIGENVTEEMIENIIRKVKPDFIQIDCKGHPGRSSYPTDVGNRAGGYVKDTLKLWREVTARHGVALYMHYSGVWDNRACELHPEWARVKPDGSRDKQKISVFGPYVDELMIPQLKELKDEYGVDGYWIDGDCWAVEIDYSKNAIEAFEEETGIKLEKYPKKKSDKYYRKFLDFQREGFREYLRHYVNAIHRHYPNAQITSNWAFSSIMFEPLTADLDFLSGDYPLQDSVNMARYEARCLRHQGKPWDLMSWGFSAKWEDVSNSSVKTPIQLKREASVVLSTGGGFQVYFKQNRDGSIRDWNMNIMSEVAEFCRKRQEICHKAESVPQICLFYSTESIKRKMTRPFHPRGLTMSMKGILWALLDNQYHVDIRGEHNLRDKMSQYPVIVIPEWQYIAQDIKREFIKYVRGGGNLLIVGPVPADIFSDQLGVKFKGNINEKKKWLFYNGVMSNCTDFYRAPLLTKNARPIGKLYNSDQVRGNSQTAATVRKFGKGKIAAIYFNMGYRYHTSRTSHARIFIGAVVDKVFDSPMVEVEGSHKVDLVVNRKEGKLAVNLVNTAGSHANKDVYTFDSIPSVGPLKVKIRLPKEPKNIYLQPQGKEMGFSWENGIVEVEPFVLEIHNILVVKQ